MPNFSHLCPTLAQLTLPTLPTFAPKLGKGGKSWASLPNFGAMVGRVSWAKVGQSWAWLGKDGQRCPTFSNYAHLWSKGGQSWQSELGQSWAKVGKVGHLCPSFPTFAQPCPTLTQLTLPTLPTFTPKLGKIGQRWEKLGIFAHLCPTFPTFAQLCPTLGQRWAELAE